ncbi:hypothetical protein Dip510_000071 [Elusimicrobium posterum]|uniref:hypothetical protein n=1 Tax=Elusimicrobium posterum TaxID=3116653 RepID=UPI003C723681
MSEKYYAKIIDEKTKKCIVGTTNNTAFFKSVNMSLMEVEQGYDNNWYLKGFAPQAPEKTIEEEILFLEGAQTPRMLRGAALGNEADIKLLEEIEDKIEVLRLQIKRN